jgi:hypothetical protein
MKPPPRPSVHAPGKADNRIMQLSYNCLNPRCTSARKNHAIWARSGGFPQPGLARNDGSNRHGAHLRFPSPAIAFRQRQPGRPRRRSGARRGTPWSAADRQTRSAQASAAAADRRCAACDIFPAARFARTMEGERIAHPSPASSAMGKADNESTPSVSPRQLRLAQLLVELRASSN